MIHPIGLLLFFSCLIVLSNGGTVSVNSGTITATFPDSTSFRICAAMPKTAGYLAISLGPPANSKVHTGSDVIMSYWSSAGACKILDGYTTSHSFKQDASQDVNPISMTIAANVTSVCFSRTLAGTSASLTGVVNSTYQDFSVQPGSKVLLGWATYNAAGSTVYNTQHSSRGAVINSTVFTISTPAPTQAPTTPAPTQAPTTLAPTIAGQTRPPTTASPTNAPTRSPTPAPTDSPTLAPTTPAPTPCPHQRDEDQKTPHMFNDTGFSCTFYASGTDITFSMWNKQDYGGPNDLPNGNPAWIAISLDRPDAPTFSHYQSDIYMGFRLSSGSFVVLDAYTNTSDGDNSNVILFDSHQDVYGVSGTYTSATGTLKITFSRKLVTGDPFDQDIVNAPMTFAWAMGIPDWTNFNFQSTSDFQQNFPSHDDSFQGPGYGGSHALNLVSGKIEAADLGSNNGKLSQNGFTLEFKYDGISAITMTKSYASSTGYLAVAISPITDPSLAHGTSGMYISSINSAGKVDFSLGFSTDTVNSPRICTNDATVVSASVGQTTSVTFTRKIASTGDKCSLSISNAGNNVGWAVGSVSTPASAGLVIQEHASNGRGGWKVNLLTGSVDESKKMDPGVVYILLIVAFVVVYSFVRHLWIFYKHFRAIDFSKFSSKSPRSTPNQPREDLPVDGEQSEVVQDAEQLGGESAVLNMNDVANRRYLNDVGEEKDVQDRDYSISRKPSDAGVELRESTRLRMKTAKNPVMNWSHKAKGYRIPKSQIAVGDLLLGLMYLTLNLFMNLYYYKKLGFSYFATWGYLAAANTFMVTLPATRNSILVWLLGVPFDKTIMYHRWLGRWIVVQSAIHWSGYFYDWKQWGDKYFSGLYAICALTLVFITSIEWLRRRYFNFFYYAHFVFLAFFVTGSLHSPTSFRLFTMSAAVAYAVDKLMRLFWGAWPSKTVKMEVFEGAVRVTFHKHCMAKYTVGQYVFLNFPELSLLEWHPFTLASGPDEQHLEVMIKGLGNYTKKLIERVEKSSESMWIRVDGPYGKWPFAFNRYKAVVLVVGGVGVTPAMSLLRHVYHINRTTEDKENHLTDVFFVWTCKTTAELEWYRPILEQALSKSQFQSKKFPTLHPLIHITRFDNDGLPEYCKTGRPDLEKVFEDVDNAVPQDEPFRVAVVACGPEAMVNSTWDQTSKRTGHRRRFDFHHETFNF